MVVVELMVAPEVAEVGVFDADDGTLPDVPVCGVDGDGDVVADDVSSTDNGVDGDTEPILDCGVVFSFFWPSRMLLILPVNEKMSLVKFNYETIACKMYLICCQPNCQPSCRTSILE